MKLFLEEETTEKIDGEDVNTISVIKEISDVKEASKGQIIHKCYHDEADENGQCPSCKRIKI